MNNNLEQKNIIINIRITYPRVELILLIILSTLFISSILSMVTNNNTISTAISSVLGIITLCTTLILLKVQSNNKKVQEAVTKAVNKEYHHE